MTSKKRRTKIRSLMTQSRCRKLKQTRSLSRVRKRGTRGTDAELFAPPSKGLLCSSEDSSLHRILIKNQSVLPSQLEEEALKAKQARTLAKYSECKYYKVSV